MEWYCLRKLQRAPQSGLGSTFRIPAGLLLLLALCSGNLLARPRELAAIDQYCSDIRTELSASTPFIFSGPDPWTELDDIPAEMPDEALAYVYTQGPSIRWVYLRLVDEQAGWQEDIHYFFHEDGNVAKRVRRLFSAAANLELDETTYYESGDVLKQITRHHALAKGLKKVADFSDPDAPVYLTVDDLPFPDIPDLWDRLA